MSTHEKTDRPRFVRKPPEKRALILAALIHPEDIAPFHRLRSRFFPGHRNYLSAHITLFHYIRAGIRTEFIEAVREVVREQSPGTGKSIPLLVKPPFSMGKGVAYGIEAAPLQQLRRPLRERFGPHLKPQDARPWKKPHITIQNKVDKQTATRLAGHLQDRYSPCHIRLRGLACYRYDYGPWTLLEEARF